MAKEKTPGGPINRHKEMAMGKSITAMKKGGEVKADKKSDTPTKDAGASKNVKAAKSSKFDKLDKKGR